MTRESTEQVVVQTADFEKTVETMRAAFGDVDLRRDDDGPSAFALRSVRAGGLWTCRWAMGGIGGGSRDEDTGQEDVFLTGILLRGRIRMWSRWNDIDVERPFLYPDRIDSTLGRPHIVNFAIPRDLVREHARAATGHDDLEVRFTGTAPVDPVLDRTWRDTVASTARSMTALADRADIDLAVADLAGTAAALLIRTFPNTAMEAIERVGGTAVNAVRRATTFMDDNLDGAITVPEIARAARLSTRGLYAAFRRDLGATPMEYLRAGRLAAARQELLAADPTTTSIADVALRWGFPQEQRFVESYLASHGEAPEVTLLR